MAETYESGVLDTSNSFIKYKIIVTEAESSPSGKKRLIVSVKSWRTNSGYTTNRSGTCYVRFWTDESSSATRIYQDQSQSWTYPNKPVSQNSNTTMYYDNSIDIDISDIPANNEIYIDSKLVFNATSSAPQYTSNYQGFTVKLGTAEEFIIVQSPIDVRSETVTVQINTSVECDEWWYIVQNKDNSIYIPWTKFSTDVGTSKTLEITGLEPNTEYNIRCSARKNNTPNAYANTSTYYIRTTLKMVDTFGRVSLFDADATDFTTNGIGSLSESAISCTVVEERNGSFELEMDYPINGKYFNEIEHRRIILAKPNPYSLAQPFRIYGITKPFNGVITVLAAHISYDLSGYTVAPFNATSVSDALNKLKSSIDVASCPFVFWTDKTTSGNIATTYPMTARSILGGVEGSILDRYHGEYEFDGYHVKLWSSRGSNNGVHIRYGKNLTDYNQNENCNNMYTHIRPYWYKEEKENDKTYYKLVDLPTSDYPNHLVTVIEGATYVKILPLDLSGEFDDEPSIAELKNKTDEYILEHKMTEPEVSVKVSFVSLTDSDEYKDLKMLETIKLCDRVTVDFPKMNISVKNVPCVKTTYNALMQRYDSIELGTLQTYLSDTIAIQNEDIKDNVSRNEFANVIAKITS